jgi:hypothetical protein
MEGAIRAAIQDSLGDYVKRGLGKSDISFPMVLRNLELNEKKVQEIWDEERDSALQLTKGVIGSVKIEPGWMGNIEVTATNVQLSFSFSATQALKNKMKPDTEHIDSGCNHGGGGPAPWEPPAPPPNCPPRFCSAHDTSDKRVKGEPVSRDCQNCGITLTSSYEGFKLCPPCSEKQQRCMICGCHASKQTCVDAGPQKQNPGHNVGNNERGSFAPGCEVPRDRQQASTSRAMAGNNDSMFLPPNVNDDSMFLPAKGSQFENPQQVFETRLPPGQRGQLPPGGRPQHPGQQPWGGRMSPNMQTRGARQEDNESFAGFLRFVATDIWKTCHADARRLDSPERPFVRRGGA